MDGMLTVWAGQAGVVIGLSGNGTARVSIILRQFVSDSLRNGIARAELDLSHCDGLDSTFLGCLIQLHQEAPNRFALVRPSEAVAKILGATQLDRYLTVQTASLDCRQETGTELAHDLGDDPLTLGRHILDCHRTLLAIEGPHQPACEAVVRNLAAGLGIEDDLDTETKEEPAG